MSFLVEYYFNFVGLAVTVRAKRIQSEISVVQGVLGSSPGWIQVLAGLESWLEMAIFLPVVLLDLYVPFTSGLNALPPPVTPLF